MAIFTLYFSAKMSSSFIYYSTLMYMPVALMLWRLPFVFSALQNKCIFFFLQLWPFFSNNNPQQLILQTLRCDHEVEQRHLDSIKEIQMVNISKKACDITVTSYYSLFSSDCNCKRFTTHDHGPKHINEFFAYAYVFICCWERVWMRKTKSEQVNVRVCMYVCKHVCKWDKEKKTLIRHGIYRRNAMFLTLTEVSGR